MSKSLGRVLGEALFEARGDVAYTDDELQAAAEAVALEAERRALTPGVQMQLEKAVIEAAKAWAKWMDGETDVYTPQEARLADAVDALEVSDE